MTYYMQIHQRQRNLILI